MWKQKARVTTMQKNENRKSVGLGENTLGYYKRVSATLKEAFSTEHDKELFLNNVFTQITEEAIPVCQHFITSCIIEELLESASLANLNTLLTVLYEQRDCICTNQYSSHVLQTALCCLPKFIAENMLNVRAEDEEWDGDDASNEFKSVKLLLSLCQYMQDNLEMFVADKYASHLLRCMVQLLGGTYPESSTTKSTASKEWKKKYERRDAQHLTFTVPAVFITRLYNILSKMFKSTDFPVYLTDPYASPCVVTLLTVLHKVDEKKCQKYLKKVVMRAKIEGFVDKLVPLVADRVGSFLVERIILLATPPILTKLYKNLLKGKLIQFAVHSTANYILQSLLKRLTDEEMCSEVISELCASLEDILGVGHFSVAVAMADYCVRTGNSQDEFRDALMSSFHCRDPFERQMKMVPVIASLNTYEMFYHLTEDSQPLQVKDAAPFLKAVNYHGSLLLQALVKFSGVKQTVASFMDMKPRELRNMACDACGSHVLESFFQSPTISLKQKDTLLNRFKGLFVELACESHGSRVMESFWKNVKLKQKLLVAEELCKQEEKIRGNKYGFFIHRNFGLRLLMGRPNDWREKQGSESRKRKMFEDILKPDASKMQKIDKDRKERAIQEEVSLQENEEECRDADKP